MSLDPIFVVSVVRVSPWIRFSVFRVGEPRFGVVQTAGGFGSDYHRVVGQRAVLDPIFSVWWTTGSLDPIFSVLCCC